MMLKFVDHESKIHSYEVDPESFQVLIISPCIIRQSWLETAMTKQKLTIDRSAFDCGSNIDLNTDGVRAFALAYDC